MCNSSLLLWLKIRHNKFWVLGHHDKFHCGALYLLEKFYEVSLCSCFKHLGIQGLFIQFWQQNMVSAGGETRSISDKTMSWQNNTEYCH